jgi:hypothetical protein
VERESRSEKEHSLKPQHKPTLRGQSSYNREQVTPRSFCTYCRNFPPALSRRIQVRSSKYADGRPQIAPVVQPGMCAKAEAGEKQRKDPQHDRFNGECSSERPRIGYFSASWHSHTAWDIGMRVGQWRKDTKTRSDNVRQRTLGICVTVQTERQPSRIIYLVGSVSIRA